MQYSHMYIFVILKESRKTKERCMCLLWYIRLSWWTGKISCTYTIYFFKFEKIIHSFAIFFCEKVQKKICSLIFAENMCTYMYNILFLEFHRYYCFLSINLSWKWKMCRIVCHFTFSNKVNFAKMAHVYNYIALTRWTKWRNFQDWNDTVLSSLWLVLISSPPISTHGPPQVWLVSWIFKIVILKISHKHKIWVLFWQSSLRKYPL